MQNARDRRRREREGERERQRKTEREIILWKDAYTFFCKYPVKANCETDPIKNTTGKGGFASKKSKPLLNPYM